MDNNLALLKDPVFDLPINRTNADFYGFLKDSFDKYRSKIQLFEGSLGKLISERKNEINELCDSLLCSLSAYYEGYPSRAFNLFSEGMIIINNWLWKQKRDISLSEGVFAFRGRPAFNGGSFTKDKMFHIPFENRHLITSKRYSIPGYPCLYLSSSVYGCWLECGRPEFDSMNFSRFNLSEYRFLDLSVKPKTQAFLYEFLLNDGKESIIDMFNLYVLSAWPLFAACSIRRMDFGEQKGDFFAEYIFPQMLMEWVRLSHDLDGVKYFSVQFSDEIYEWQGFVNYAIPVKKVQPIGHCPQLIYDLPYSDPISFINIQNDDKYSALENFVGNEEKSIERVRASRGVSYFKNNEPYFASKYGRLEFTLSKMPLSRLQV